MVFETEIIVELECARGDKDSIDGEGSSVFALNRKRGNKASMRPLMVVDRTASLVVVAVVLPLFSSWGKLVDVPRRQELAVRKMNDSGQ